MESEILTNIPDCVSIADLYNSVKVGVAPTNVQFLKETESEVIVLVICNDHKVFQGFKITDMLELYDNVWNYIAIFSTNYRCTWAETMLRRRPLH